MSSKAQNFESLILAAMSLVVLSDHHVKEILENLTLDEFESFRSVLSSALHEYSNSIQAVEDGSYHQPARVSTHSNATGATTLYMPSASPAGMGVKGRSLSLTVSMIGV